VTDRRIDWEPANWLITVVTFSVLTAACLVLAGRFDLVVFIAPLLGALAGAWWSTRPDHSLRVSVTQSASRLFETETVSLNVELTAPTGVELVDVTLEPSAELAATPRALHQPSPGTVRGEWELRALHWGRGRVRLRVVARGAGGLLVGQLRCEVGELAIFPRADRLGAVPRPMDLPDLLGMHLGRRKGEGVEFAGIREYQPGDSLRSVNWAVSARRGGLHVTERLTEQAAKVVVLIDAASDIEQPGRSTLELSVHGAVAVVAAALRRGDRAGVVALGGVVRWLAPNLGRRHFYQVVEALLDVQPGGGSLPSDAAGFPPTVLPHGAAVVVFSPMLDDRLVHALADLRRRGHGLAVVDVLRAEPRARPGADYDELAVRMWRLGRRGMRHRLADLGIPVGHWAEGAELDEVLRPMSRRPLLGTRG
jgi:uncharacterized protein (DUF58 family)